MITYRNSGISSFEFNINQGLIKAIENNSKDSFQTLSSFIRDIIRLTIKYKAIGDFQRYIFFPVRYYSISYESSTSSSVLNSMYKMCAEYAARSLKDIIWFDLGAFQKNAFDIEDKKVWNRFYYWSFYSFSNLLYEMVMRKDIAQFQFAMNEFDQISSYSLSNKSYELRYKIWESERENKPEIDTKGLKDQLEIEEKFDKYKRHTLLGIRYWILFLYQSNRLKANLAEQFLKYVNIQYIDSKDLLKDILYFKGNIEVFYMGWDNWDFKDRPTGKPYPSFMASDWLIFGFTVDILYSNYFSFNTNDLDTNNLHLIKFLYEDVKGDIDLIKKNIAKWDLIYKDIKTPINQKIEMLLATFSNLNRVNLTATQRAIANAPISQTKVNEFKNKIGAGWRSQARIHRLFKKYGNIEHIIDDNTKLKIVGRRTIFEKAKMMFIDGEHYQMIYGAENMGGQTGIWEEDLFFNTILNNFNRITGISVLETLNKSLDELSQKNITPNLILLPFEYFTWDKELQESKDFISALSLPDDEELPYFFLGRFKGIPIYTLRSVLFKNNILVCNFNAAFRMRYKTNPNWFDEELKVEVIRMSDEEARRILNDEPSKWKNIEEGVPLSDEDAEVLIKTSVITDIWTVIDFQIIDSDAYIIGIVSTE